MTEQKPIKTIDEWVAACSKIDFERLCKTATAMSQSVKDAIKAGTLKEEDLSIEPLLAPLREYYETVGKKFDSDQAMVCDYLRKFMGYNE